MNDVIGMTVGCADENTKVGEVWVISLPDQEGPFPRRHAGIKWNPDTREYELAGDLELLEAKLREMFLEMLPFIKAHFPQ